MLVGYRWYDAKGERPAFPFGFGLSYTRFRFSGLRVKRLGAAKYRVSLTVTNTGRRRGWAVPEVYVAIPPSAGLIEPPEQLKGFVKLSLAARKHRRVSITLDARAFSYWSSQDQRWRIAPGCDVISVGSSSRSHPLHSHVCPT